MAIPLLIPALVSGAASIGGSVVNALSRRLTKEERARMKELEARKAAGTLGLTDEERAVAESQVVDPVRAAMREEFLRSRAGSLADPGQAARGSLARQDATTRTLTETGRQLAALDLQAKRDQEAELAALGAKRADAKAGAGQAAAEIIGTGALVAGDVVNLAGQAKADRELFRALYPGGTDDELDEFTQFAGVAPARVTPAPDRSASGPLRTDLEAFRMWDAAGRPADVEPFGRLPASQVRALEAAASLRAPPPRAPSTAVPLDAEFFRALEGTDFDAETYYNLTRDAY